jgi:hypothetical protein
MVAGDMDFDSEGEEVLEDAKRELDACRYPFLTENFDEALLILRHDGILTNLKYTRQNVSRRHTGPDDTIGADLVDAILNANRFDAALYAHAKSLYDELTRAYPDLRSGRSLMSRLLSRDESRQ